MQRIIHTAEAPADDVPQLTAVIVTGSTSASAYFDRPIVPNGTLGFGIITIDAVGLASVDHQAGSNILYLYTSDPIAAGQELVIPDEPLIYSNSGARFPGATLILTDPISLPTAERTDATHVTVTYADPVEIVAPILPAIYIADDTNGFAPPVPVPNEITAVTLTTSTTILITFATTLPVAGTAIYFPLSYNWRPVGGVGFPEFTTSIEAP